MSISQHFIIKQHEHWLRGEARVPITSDIYKL